MKLSDEDWENTLTSGVKKLREYRPKRGRFTKLERCAIAQIMNIYQRRMNWARQNGRLVP